ncbi:MAG: ATP-binding protein [Verrucomicrobia bacterium]|nr:ATP-binding protein [Verrucomicrobiota bacterium]
MKRSIFNSLRDWKEDKKRKPLILRGARQVGKTYILQEFGRRFFPRSHYFNFEKSKALHSAFAGDIDPKTVTQKLSFHADTSIDLKNDLLIFDEIQECPRALTSLKYFEEEMPEIAVCSAGSLLGVHLGPVSFPVGKVNILSMYPLSFREFLEAIGDERSLPYYDAAISTKNIPQFVHEHLWERLKWYFITGGLPEVVQTFSQTKDDLYEACKASRKLQNEIIVMYLADMAKHSGKINAMHLDRLWHSVPEQLGKSQDGSAKKFIFKDAVAGLNRYDRLAGAIDWLEKAGLIIKARIVNSGKLPFSAYSQENTFKLFLFDIGILGALSNLEPREILAQDYGSYKGYFAENFVAQELLVSGQKQLYSWQENTAEIEFLLQADGKAIPIEVKSGGVTHAKSLHIFAAKYHSPSRVIFSANTLQVNEQTGVHRYPLYLASDLLRAFS